MGSPGDPLGTTLGLHELEKGLTLNSLDSWVLLGSLFELPGLTFGAPGLTFRARGLTFAAPWAHFCEKTLKTREQLEQLKKTKKKLESTYLGSG